jgi:hypothetical protein
MILSRDELTVGGVYEALPQMEKMKNMVWAKGLSSKGEALQVRDRSEQRNTNYGNRYKSDDIEIFQSPDETRNYAGIVRRKITLLRIVGKL